jgi:4-amino-4-deoxy-L-arabinose transferase-like glycosyltransferase
MDKFVKFLKKNWITIGLVIIILGSVFVRVYKFEDWLLFKADQVRDATLAMEAFNNGPGELPLLGPRAAGTYLRLGPVFYYMQYGSAKIFNSLEPHVLAYPDLLFSILAIPLLFYFLKHFFSQRDSLLITLLYSFSYILIQYSRYAWNPNSITFWGLLFIVGLYKTSQEKDKKRAGLWLLVVALGYAIVSQLHFVAFVGYPVVAVLFWVLFFPKKINWKYWVGAILIVLFFYAPVILSNLSTGGDYVNQFVYALTAKNESGEVNLCKDWQKISTSFTNFITSVGHKDSFLSFLGGTILILTGIFATVFYSFRDKKNRRFAYLILVWFAVFILILLKTDNSMKPRFFMPIASIPFIFLGFSYLLIRKIKLKIVNPLALLVIVVILLLNFNGLKTVANYFETQDKDSIGRTIFIEQDDAKVLKKHLEASEYMARIAQKNNKMVCFSTSAIYERTYEYLFEIYFPNVKYDRISKSFKDKEGCQYFSIITAGNEKRISNDYDGYFDFVETKSFGRLEVWVLEAKEEFLNLSKKEEDSKSKTDEEIQADLKESLEKDYEEITEEFEKEEDEQETEKDSKPERKERVLWKEVFN